MANPLFPNLSRSQRKARQEWKKSMGGKLMDELQRAKRSVEGGGDITQEFRRGYAMYRRHGWSAQASRLLWGGGVADIAGQVMQYGKGSSAAAAALQPLFKSLGPLGSLLSAMLSVRGKTPHKGVQAELEAAKAFIEAFGGEAKLPKPKRVGTGRARRLGKEPSVRETTPTVTTVRDSLDEARKLLEQHGYRVAAPGEEEVAPERPPVWAKPLEDETFPGGVSRTTARGTPRNVVKIQIDGTTRQFPVTHPIITKAMVETPSSSNVYAFSYDYDTSQLFIRFKQPEKFGGGAGPLYGYSNVPARVFIAMLKHTAAPGVFVWDNIRNRGTVSGHKYDYRLIAVRGGYVPRKATVRRNDKGQLEEWYERRRVKVRSIQTGRITTLESGAPMRAMPVRGLPNRG